MGVNAAMKVFQALNLAALFTGPAGVLLGVAGGIAAATAAVVGFVEATRDGGPAVREMTEAAREMNAVMEEAGSAHEDTAADILATADVAGRYIERLEEIQAAEGENAEESQAYQSTLALLLRTIPELSSCISQTTDEYGRSTHALNTDTEALRANTEEWKKNAQAKAYQDYLNSMYDAYGAVLQEAAENAIGLTEAESRRTDLTEKLEKAQARVNELNRKGTALTQEETDELIRLNGEIDEHFAGLVDAQNAVDDHTQAVERDNAAVARQRKSCPGWSRRSRMC